MALPYVSRPIIDTDYLVVTHFRPDHDPLPEPQVQRTGNLCEGSTGGTAGKLSHIIMVPVVFSPESKANPIGETVYKVLRHAPHVVVPLYLARRLLYPLGFTVNDAVRNQDNFVERRERELQIVDLMPARVVAFMARASQHIKVYIDILEERKVGWTVV